MKGGSTKKSPKGKSMAKKDNEIANEKKKAEETPNQSEEEESEDESEEEEEMKMVEVEVETMEMDDYCRAIKQKDSHPRPNPSVIFMPNDPTNSFIITTPGGCGLYVEDNGTPMVLPNAAADNNFQGVTTDFFMSQVNPNAMSQLIGVGQDDIDRVMEGLARRKMRHSLPTNFPESVHPKCRGRPPKKISSEDPKTEEHLLPKAPAGVKISQAGQVEMKNQEDNEAGENGKESSPLPGSLPEGPDASNEESGNKQKADGVVATKTTDPEYTPKPKRKTPFKRKAGSSYCSAPTCHNTREKNMNKPFYRFPKDQALCDRWIMACGRPELLEKDSGYCYRNLQLCSDHFEDHMLLGPPSKGTRLVYRAIPSIFDGSLVRLA